MSVYKIIHIYITGSLLPSHGLPPFGANITNITMSESLCGTSMFGSDRWSVGVSPMTAGNYQINYYYYAFILTNIITNIDKM
jgi:hypothetical protein